MPSLADPKREKFAQFCAKGLTTIEAYVRAGYKRNTGNATTLRKRPEVTARIEELMLINTESNQLELELFLTQKGYTPSYFIRQLIDIADKATRARKFDVAAKTYKDLAAELFGMFLTPKERNLSNLPTAAGPSTTIEKNEQKRAIDFAGLAKALEGIAPPDRKGPQIEGIAESVPEPARVDVS